MCAIAGMVSSVSLDGFRSSLDVMLSHLRHRGPDELNAFLGSQVFLGNARLAINDVKSKTQPAKYKNNYAVFNGEIYNYAELRVKIEKLTGQPLQTHCDTEIIPILFELFGPNFVTQLDGQFAIALYDAQNRCVYLYRDRLGKKPLYYSIREKVLFFSSEVTALRRVVDAPFSFQELFNLISLWSPQYSFFSGIFPVKEGCYLRVSLDHLRMETIEYWSLLTVFSKKPQTTFESDALFLVEDKIQASVNKRLRSDVGYGVYLSGGLDSTIITALLSEKSKKLTSYSLTFPDHVDYHEGDYQREVAHFYGIENIRVPVTALDLVNRFEDFVLHSSAVLFRTAPVAMAMLSREASKKEKVIFSGEGADELFFGYDLFKEVKYRQRMGHRSPSVQNSYIKKLYPYLLNERQLKFLQYSLLQPDASLFSSHALRIKNINVFLNFISVQQALPTISLMTAHADMIDLDPLRRAQYLEYKTLLLHYLLSIQGDIPAMMHAIELRCPFLDHHLIEAVSHIPIAQLFPRFCEKHLLKVIYAKKIPESILRRVKQPYRAPEAIIFKGQLELRERFHAFTDYGFFDKKSVLLLVDKIIQGVSVSYVDSFCFLVIFSSLLLINVKQNLGNFPRVMYHSVLREQVLCESLE